MKNLEKYYNLTMANDNQMPEFSALSDEEKARIKNSLGFAFWNVSEACRELSIAFEKVAPIFRRKKLIRRS